MRGAWRLKEPFCGSSHLIGAVLSLGVLLVLLFEARGRLFHSVGFLVYGISLTALYTASGLYHSLRVSPRSVSRLQRLDFIAIFLLIAGTYAPICLISLRDYGHWGWLLLGIEATLALGGILAVVTLKNRFPSWLRVTVCGVMTWLALCAVNPLWSALSPAGFGWLIAGIVVYSVGTLILATDWPHLWRGRFSAHDLWHLFVLGGSACHCVLMLRYVAPAA